MMDVRRRITTDSAIGGVNIVPVIDLCLVLLVILLVISPMMAKSPVEVTLPNAHAKREKADETNNISITVSPDGRLAVNSKEVPLEFLKPEVAKELKTHRANRSGPDGKEGDAAVYVIFRADENVQFGRLRELIQIAKDAGATRVALGTKLIEADKASPAAEGGTP
jgi:biopolymer transport protein ExbD